MSLWQDKESKKRKTSSAVTAYDIATLRANYTFLPEQQSSSSQAAPAQSKQTTTTTTWQQRMVLQYHSHLYKDCVLANMTRCVKDRQLGLRWRTAAEVRAGRGVGTCGNLHCPSVTDQSRANDTANDDNDDYDDAQRIQEYLNKSQREERKEDDNQQQQQQQEDLEKARVLRLPHGLLLTDFEVPFTYKEQGQRKTELVKLRLCIRCAPLLFQSKGETEPFGAARQARALAWIQNDNNDEAAATTKRRQEESRSSSAVVDKANTYSLSGEDEEQQPSLKQSKKSARIKAENDDDTKGSR